MGAVARSALLREPLMRQALGLSGELPKAARPR
jgi:hypothetical protein